MNRLKQLRESKKLTLDDIERETGIKRGTYNNYENGKTNPKSNWQVLADYFNVSVPYLQGAYSKEEICKLVQSEAIEWVKQERSHLKFILLSMKHLPTLNRYLIARGIVSYDVPKDNYSLLIDNEQINSLEFWDNALEPLFKEKIVNILLTKPNITDSKEEALDFVYSGMESAINRVQSMAYNQQKLSTEEQIKFIDTSEYSYQNLLKRGKFLADHEYWSEPEELPDGSIQSYPYYDFSTTK